MGRVQFHTEQAATHSRLDSRSNPCKSRHFLPHLHPQQRRLQFVQPGIETLNLIIVIT
jgi:hypothetical protein